MDWINIALAVPSGLLAVVIANLFVRNPKERKVAFFVVFIISYAVLRSLSREFILPEIKAIRAESMLLQEPVFQVIKMYDPKIYDSILADYKDGLRKGKDNTQLSWQIRGYIKLLAQKRVPSASDEAVVSYMQVFLLELDSIKKYSSDSCFQFLYTQNSSIFAPARDLVSKQTQEADLAALAQVIRTSSVNPQPVPQESDVKPALQLVYRDLARDYGDDIDMLLNPAGPNVDKTKVCIMTEDFYARIIKLPQDQNGKVLRFIFSQTTNESS